MTFITRKRCLLTMLWGYEVRSCNLNKLYSRACLLAAQLDGVLEAHVRML